MYLKTFESNCPLNFNFKVLNFFFGFMECKEKYWTDDELSRKRWHECLFKMLWDDHYNDTHVLTKYTQGTESSSQLWWKNTLELIWCSIRLNKREELSLFLLASLWRCSFSTSDLRYIDPIQSHPIQHLGLSVLISSIWSWGGPRWSKLV